MKRKKEKEEGEGWVFIAGVDVRVAKGGFC
jgi:hypothetical protein